MSLPSISSVVMPSEVIDETGNVGRHPSIAVDSKDRIHISYWDYTNRDLKYATNATGSWVIDSLDTGGNVGSHSSIAVDSKDKIHISYHKATVDPLYPEVPQGNLMYITDASGSWINETVEIGSGVTKGLETSIAIDSKDRIHISYRISVTLSGSNLKYATNASGSWETFVIDQENHGGQFSSIAVDSNDKIHISYYCEQLFDNGLKYATDASGSWVVSMIDDSSAVVGYYTSLAIDSNDKMHISYSDETNRDLKYATDASDSWVADTLDSSGYVGRFTSIAIDSNDGIHISYYDETNTDLKYATDVSGSWAYMTIDDDGAVGWETSVAIDSMDNLHIAYYDGTNADLKYIMITDASVPIPEFSDLVIPVIAIALIMMAAGRSGAWRKPSRE